MIGELLNNEVNEIKPNTTDSYRDIKPDNKMTPKEMYNAVENEFSKASQEFENTVIDGNKEYFDDNQLKYREGNDLIPNNTFEINNYIIKTDDMGRVISTEGQLQVKDHEDRRDMDPRSVVNKGDMRDTDDRGHLIADRFNGSGGIENLVPMDSELNRHGDYMKMENTLADAVNAGASVYLKVEPRYENNSTRPSEFKVTYTIDGEKEVHVFKNESEAKV